MALDEQKRQANEAKFDKWQSLKDGGRLYSVEVFGRSGWKAIYFKEVDGDETTTRFWQEIHDETGSLVEIHEKYPEDKGHRRF